MFKVNYINEHCVTIAKEINSKDELMDYIDFCEKWLEKGKILKYSIERY